MYIVLVLITIAISNTNSQQSVTDALRSNIFLNLPEEDSGGRQQVPYHTISEETMQKLRRNMYIDLPKDDNDSGGRQPMQQQQQQQQVPYHTISEETKQQFRKNMFLDSFEEDEQPQRIPNVPSRLPDKIPPSRTKSLFSQYNEVCGYTSDLEQSVPSVTQLIANGDTVSHHYPWLVAIYNVTKTKWNFICGGTLITSKHMISAAHCFPRKESDINQFVITNDLQKNRVVREAQEIILHPDYLPLESNADIALVIFNTEVPVGLDIRPICLWLKGNNDISDVIRFHGVVAGWGFDENNQKSKALPKEARMPIVNYLNCMRDNTKFVGVLGPKTFCAGDKNNSGPCPGDSGSGFIIQLGDRWFLRGVVSTTLLKNKDDCQITDYTAMTDVAKYSSWIARNVG